MAIIDHLKTIGKIHKKYMGEFGVEIETETKKNYIPPEFTYWMHHADGSLRDYGIEYVLKQPVQYKTEVRPALEEFRDKTKEIKFIRDSVSTSVHVHVNMLNESFKTLGNFLTLYTLFENLLIRYSGPDRLSNLFCLPICDAEETYKNIMNMFKHIENKNYKGLSFGENAVKYAACNLSALYKYGSIEIRSFRGETDIDRIYNWISILYQMLDYARRDHDPKNIIVSWKDRRETLLDNVFGDYRKELAHKDELQLIEQNLWYAASVAYSVRNWASLDVVQQIPEFKAKQKDLEAMARQLFGQPWETLALADQMHVNHILQLQHNMKHGVSVPPVREVEQAVGIAQQVAQNRRQRRLQDVPFVPREDIVRFNPPPVNEGAVNRAREWVDNLAVAAQAQQPDPINPIEWQRMAANVLGQRADRDREEREERNRDA